MTLHRVLLFATVVWLLSISATGPLLAQDSSETLSGTVTDAFGKPRSNVQVSVKNSATGQTTDTQSDSSGHYSLANLTPGDYEVTASADGFATATSKLTIGAGASPSLNLTLLPAPDQSQESVPNAPSATGTAPSLEDLGFSPAETRANAQQQALLDKRTHMLKIHQRMGLMTTIPLLATVITSVNAGGRSTSTSSRDLHVALGALTGDLYGITAWYAIRAPRIKGTPKRGPIRFHEAMAWIHGPGMILTPILGAMAFEQKNNGQHVHGIAQAHGPVAIVTAGAFGAALLSVSVKF